MEKKTIAGGGVIHGAIYIFCGVLVLPVGLGLAFSYPHELWWLGAVMCGASALMIYGGIQGIRKSRQQYNQAAMEEARLRLEVAEQLRVPIQTKADAHLPAAKKNSVSNELLARWVFNAPDWKKFIKLERKRRKSSTKYEAIALLIVGTIVLMLTRDASFFLALTITGIITAIISALRWRLTMRSYGHVLPENEVLVTDQSVMINGVLSAYRSDNYWLDKIQLIDGEPDVIEITYAWDTRKGRTFDELRFPVPAGKRKEAEELISKILKVSQG